MVVLSKETGVCAEHAVCKAKRRSAGLSRLCVETRVEHPGVRVWLCLRVLNSAGRALQRCE
jgi:hypothetical protein